MNEHERYLFDLNGYLAVEDFLTPAEVAALNEAIDRNPDRVVERDSPLNPSSTLKGDFVRSDLEGMLMWPKPWCEPFRELIDHPQDRVLFERATWPEVLAGPSVRHLDVQGRPGPLPARRGHESGRGRRSSHSRGNRHIAGIPGSSPLSWAARKAASSSSSSKSPPAKSPTITPFLTACTYSV